MNLSKDLLAHIVRECIRDEGLIDMKYYLEPKVYLVAFVSYMYHECNEMDTSPHQK